MNQAAGPWAAPEPSCRKPTVSATSLAASRSEAPIARVVGTSQPDDPEEPLMTIRSAASALLAATALVAVAAVAALAAAAAAA